MHRLIPSERFPMLYYFDGLVQDCSFPIAITLEILPHCTKPSSDVQGLFNVAWYSIKCNTVSVNDKGKYRTDQVREKMVPLHLALMGERSGSNGVFVCFWNKTIVF